MLQCSVRESEVDIRLDEGKGNEDLRSLSSFGICEEELQGVPLASASVVSTLWLSLQTCSELKENDKVPETAVSDHNSGSSAGDHKFDA